MTDRGTGYLTPADIADVHDALLNLHQTSRDMAWPVVRVQVQRMDAAGELLNVGEPVEVVFRYDATQTADRVDQSQAASITTGRVRNYAPWDIRVGDVLVLDDGRTVTITTPAPYVKNGTVRGRWKMDDGYS
jgi:hypothetical protein